MSYLFELLSEGVKICFMRADYTPSYIAFLDILGFKMFVKNHKKLYQYINSVLSDYSENKLRQKYLWLQSELERAADTAERARTNI